MSYNSCSKNKKDNNMVRPMAVGGSFYPSNKDELNQMLATFYAPYSDKKQYEKVFAVIVPHAGYVFSGAIAASAFAQINPEAEYDNIFLIGSSHQLHINGASVNDVFEYYKTPLGNVEVNTQLSKQLIAANDCFTCRIEAHTREHSLEVQLPLLKYYFKKMPPIVPILIGTDAMPVLQHIEKALKPYFTEKNLFIISCDFSHYPTYEDANFIDKRTGDAIEKGDLKNFIQTLHDNSMMFPQLATSACGHAAIEILLMLIKGRKDIKINHIEYRNSGDTPYGDKDRVVGYHSFSFTYSPAEHDFLLSKDEKATLLKIALKSIENGLNHTDVPTFNSHEITPTLASHCGAFVTLHKDGKLRGCMGRFGSRQPLYEVIEEMAQSAAFHDPRFYPLQANELGSMDIEISVLTPLKKIDDISQFTLGKQGIYIEKGGRSGTFLPQVADEVNWTKEEFLGHCSQDKAGLGWDGWKTANLYTYEAIVFSEGEE